MEKLRFRCPQCSKLYEVQSSLIESSKPLFDCLACDTRFTFDYPPSSEQILTKIVLKKPAPLSDAKIARNAMRDCPKCGAVNPGSAQECYSCHVILDKVEGLPADKSLRAQPSLVRKWRDLVNDFENQQLHEDFIMSCHQFDAHRFAVLKYQELRDAQGGDPLCEEMIKRVQALMNVTLQKQSEQQVEEQTKFKLPPQFKQYMEWAPFAISALLIVVGMSNLGYRNMIGLGVAMFILTAGIRLFIKGKII
ncbi:MAG: hypothetical protein ACLGGX_08080 [Bdellovibrionia bacterium]